MIAFKTIGDAFFPPEGIFQWSNNYYRPVVILSYMLDVDLYGDAQVAGLHISNVLYHVATTFFVWLLACRLFRHLPNGSTGAVMAAAIFAVHPIHTESVSWITGRSDVLATLFFVPGISLALLWRDTGAKWALAAAGILYMLALLSKEIAVAALIIVPAALLLTPSLADGTADGNHSRVQPPSTFTFQFRANIGMWLATAVMLLGVTGLYLALRHTDGVAYGIQLQAGWLEYVVRLEKSIAYYLVKVLVPWPQSNHVAWESAPGLLATNGAFLIALGLLVLSGLFWRRHRDGLLLLVMIWFGAALAPSIAVAVRQISGTPLAERYLYLPSVSMALLLGIACCQPRLGKWLKPATWAVAVLIVAYSLGTVERGIVWGSNLKLWTDATEKAPNRGELWNLLGVAYREQGDDAKALDAFHKAIDGDNNRTGRSYAKRNVALIYHGQNNLQRAKEYYLAAIEEQPDNPNAQYDLGVMYNMEARSIGEENDRQNQIGAKLDLAATHFAATVRLNPFHIRARWGLASVLAMQGRRLEKKGELRQAVVHYRSALVELDALIAQAPRFESRVQIQEERAIIAAALKRIAE
jgi:hypothetical protein